MVRRTSTLVLFCACLLIGFGGPADAATTAARCGGSVQYGAVVTVAIDPCTGSELLGIGAFLLAILGGALGAGGTALAAALESWNRRLLAPARERGAEGAKRAYDANENYEHLDKLVEGSGALPPWTGPLPSISVVVIVWGRPILWPVGQSAVQGWWGNLRDWWWNLPMWRVPQ